MKNFLLTTFILFLFFAPTYAQNISGAKEDEQQIISLIDQYSKARETKDAELLKSILVKDIDQLVSSGTWRRGIDTALEGMMRSSASRPGSRTLAVETIRFLNPTSAIADARYKVTNTDGSVRKMWSTFIVIYEDNRWKIAAIRNMLPAG
ncbi:MAG: SgcJ/EcaC family oxidoreductase [Verrucomicrobia bacterium]|nr:SgcJ/EcaC family oxidoreductase [Verrucomicrobiota bacterium]